MGSDVLHLLDVLVYCLLMVGLAVWVERRRTPERMRREGDEWARRHLAYVEARWTPDVDQWLGRRGRIYLWTTAPIGLALWSVPPSAGAYLACVACVPALLAIATGYSATRSGLLPPGPRVARLRELDVSDYLAPSMRITMWLTVVVVGAVWSSVAAVRTGWWIASAGVLLVVAAATVEVTGARFVRAPEPSRDVAHLYWQDAMRADVLRSAASSVAISAALMCVAMVGFSDDRHIVTALLIGCVLLGPACVIDGLAQSTPAAYMRSRLWPTLGPDQVLLPGEPVPSRGAVV